MAPSLVPPSIFIAPIQPAAAAAAKEAPCFLHPCIWSALPEDVVERVLAFLPPLSFLRFRCVCKRWDLLLSASPRFLHLRRRLSPSSPSCSFVATMRRPPSTSQGHPWSQITIHPTPFRNFACRASHGGLLCCSWGAHSQHFVVCNPVTKMWRDLPPLPLSDGKPFVPRFVALVVDDSTGDYKVVISGHVSQRRTFREGDFDHWIVVLGADASDVDDLHWISLDGNAPHHLDTFVYESVTGSWKVTGIFPSTFPLPYFRHHNSATLCNGSLIWMSTSRAMGHIYLIMCRVADDSWSSLQTPNSPTCSVLSQLIEYNGDLLIMGVDEATYSIIIWKLEPTQMIWKKIDTCPIPEERPTFPSAHTLGVQCVKGHELIHITLYLSDFRRVGVYHLTGNVWRWLPGCFSTRSIFPGDRPWTQESYFPVEPQQGFGGVHFPFEVKLEAVP